MKRNLPTSFIFIIKHLIAFTFLFLTVAPALAKESKPITPKLWQNITVEDIKVLKEVSASLDKKDYEAALQQAKAMKNRDRRHRDSRQAVQIKPNFADAVKDIILWNKFSGNIDPKKVSFVEISKFANEGPFYPTINDIRRNVERVAIASDIPYEEVASYFDQNPANSTESKLYVAQSKMKLLLGSHKSETEKKKQSAELRREISDIWVRDNFSANEEREFLEKYRDQLNQIDHINRIDRLLWDGKTSDAERIMNLVDSDYRQLFSAIIELQNFPKYVDSVVLSVPRSLRSNEGLTYRRVLWYKSKDKNDEVLELIADLPKNLQFPEKWWSLRRLYGREMLKQKNYKASYELFSRHNLPTSSSDYWEAEWTSGWIALRFLDNTSKAYGHFENLRQNVVQPVTLSRANYWLGMASERMGDKQKAIEWYKEAAKYPIFFYGQLAIHKHRNLDPVGALNDIILPKDPEITVRDMNSIAESRAVQVAYLLALTGDKSSAAKIFEWAVNNAPTEGQIAVIMKIINEVDDRELDARISRVASRKNVFFIKDKFQIVREVANDENAPLVHAIIKQESGFAPTALSKVGAIGFMQLMPETAKHIAKDVGVKYDKKKLATDISYNVILGSAYIRKLINRFEGSEMLAIASYNAGPNATQRWINEFYDPRKEKDLDKVVDWIELITYSETRNYVQRIMENLIVYKYLMSRTNYDDLK